MELYGKGIYRDRVKVRNSDKGMTTMGDILKLQIGVTVVLVQ